MLLAVNLIAGGFAYGALFGGGALILGQIRSFGAELLEIGLLGFVFALVAALFVFLLGGAVVAGGVALPCLFLIPLFDLVVVRLGLTGARRRQGMALGAVVACLVAAPLWGAIWPAGSQKTFPWLCVGTIPLVLTLQTAGALAAPGDLLGSRRGTLRFGLRGMFAQTAAVALIAWLVSAGGQTVSGLVTLMGVTGATYFAARTPLRAALARLLRRRVKRRRRERRAIWPEKDPA